MESATVEIRLEACSPAPTPDIFTLYALNAKLNLKTPGGKLTPASYINIINLYAISLKERVSIHHMYQQVTVQRARGDSRL